MTTGGAHEHARENVGATTVQSVDRALEILELLAEHGGRSASALAEDLGVHRSTAFRLLSTLERRRFVTQIGRRGEFELGPAALRIGGAVTTRIDFSRESQQICDEVTGRLGETSNVAIYSDGAAVNIAQATGPSSVSVRQQYLGQRTPLHATSSGKVLLAALGDAEVRALEPSFTSFTAATLTDIDDIRAEMRRVREQGFGAAAAEWQDHTNAVAVPVTGRDGRVIAALSVTAPAFRMAPESFGQFAEELRQFASELARRTGAQ